MDAMGTAKTSETWRKREIKPLNGLGMFFFAYVQGFLLLVSGRVILHQPVTDVKCLGGMDMT